MFEGDSEDFQVKRNVYFRRQTWRTLLFLTTPNSMRDQVRMLEVDFKHAVYIGPPPVFSSLIGQHN